MGVVIVHLTIKQQVKHLTKEEYKFSGERVRRGLYQTKDGYCFNADCNGALNVLRKSRAVDLRVLCSRGELDTPKRIRVY